MSVLFDYIFLFIGAILGQICLIAYGTQSVHYAEEDYKPCFSVPS